MNQIDEEILAGLRKAYHVRFLPPLPRPVREVRPVARLYDDRMAIMLWLAEHSLEANDVAYLIEMSDGRYAAKLYERDAEGSSSYAEASRRTDGTASDPRARARYEAHP